MPVQTRSTATVDAILQATIQVLVAAGKERLTTTLVAQRAGVSVGTLYQYFPNKSALLQGALRRHMSQVYEAIQSACERYRSTSLMEMSNGLIEAYLGAKMRNAKESAALYAVSSDIEGAVIARAAGERALKDVAALFATAKEPLGKDPDVMAAVVVSAFNGIARRILEAKSPEREAQVLRGELLALVDAYLRTCTVASLH
jgi:AcrR family transcriptional regulator